MAHVEFIAHRAGNVVAGIGSASAIADTIEVDVHLFRGRLEVRHAKVLWPTTIQWEQWEIIHPGVRPPSLADVLAAIPDRTGVWLDLKGCSPKMRRLVTALIGGVGDLTVSSRCWWVLRAFRGVDGIRTMRSVGSRWQLFAALRVRRWRPDDGVVIHERFVTPRVAHRLRGLTQHLRAWAVEDVRRASELVALGFGGLILDDLALVGEIERAVNPD